MKYNPLPKFYFVRLMITSLTLCLFAASCVTDKQIVEHEYAAVQKDSVQAGKDGNAIPLKALEIPDTIVIQPKKVRADLSALKDFKGKYPYEVKLLKNKALQIRLKKLLGTELFSFVKRIFQVESPIELEDGLFYAWGMQAHSGGDPSAVIMVDFNRDVVYAGIRRDKGTKIYSEDGSEAPQKLRDWADEPYFEDLLNSGVFN